MKKRICICCILLLALLGAVCFAQEDDTITPRTGMAVAAAPGGAALYASPGEDEAPMLDVLCGAPLYVIELEGDWARVCSCGGGASVEGYVCADDMRYGAQAMREEPRVYLHVEVIEDAKIYSACSEEAEVLREIRAGNTVKVIARGEDWVQLMPLFYCQTGAWLHGEPIGGFMRTQDLGVMNRLREETGARFVMPRADEMSYAQARERAIELALETPDALKRVPQENRNRETLETFWSDVRLIYDPDTGALRWDAFFQAGEDYEQNFNVFMELDGALIGAQASNG